MVEIAFQSCTPYHPDLPEHRHLTGWFPCVTSGNRSRDEGREQQEGSLEREDEVWLKVSGPSDFSERLPIPGASVYVRYMYMCVHVCMHVCSHMMHRNGLSGNFLLLSQSFYILNLSLPVLEVCTSL